MTDSAAVFPPGYRLTDSDTGAPIAGATLAFYDAGTTSPQTVYADRDLTTEIGTSVVTDALGRPTSDGTTPVDVFVGTADYKIVIEDADAVVIETKDGRPGATVSASAADVSVTASFPVVTKSLDYTVLAADQNKTIVVNCSGGDVALELPSAVTVGTGWKIRVQHAGSANQAIINVATGSGQLISEGSKSFGGTFSLCLNGEDCDFTSDGGNWRVSAHTPAFIKVAQGIIPITDRVSSAPSSPVQGALYLSTSAATWGGVSVADKAVVQWSGATWVPVSPYTDCGWVCYVADENLYYRYIDSAWVSEAATSSAPGTLKISTQAVMETATATDTAVMPAHQQFHPGHPKCWGVADASGTMSGSYNMTSVTDTGTGQLGTTIATDFSGVNWSGLISVYANSNNVHSLTMEPSSKAAGSASYRLRDAANGNNMDPASWHWAGLGDQ